MATDSMTVKIAPNGNPMTSMEPRRFSHHPIAPAATPTSNTESSAPPHPAFERHYRIGELAEMWQLGRERVRLLVKEERGVIGVRLGRQKAHTIYSVPESVAARIHILLRLACHERAFGSPLAKAKASRMAERVGFEPTCRLPDNTLSRRARYDHFGTSPLRNRGEADLRLYRTAGGSRSG
jgi:hypothetical protein